MGTGAIWTTSQPSEGLYSWYPNGGGFGYTSIRRDDSSDFNAIQFLSGSGFFAGDLSLAYELLNDGVTVQSGYAGPTELYGDGFRYYGFSGGTFDEVRLQVQSGAGLSFDAAAYEAGAFDSIAIGQGAVPEPAAWAMMIGGFGLVGGALRRRRTFAVA